MRKLLLNKHLLNNFKIKKELLQTNNYINAKLNLHIDVIDKNKQIEQQYSNILKNGVRKPIFPADISEHIIKIIHWKHTGILPNWNCKSGDLIVNDKKIEVKAFSSTGPSSFGPSEKWDIIYFLDCKKYINKQFKIYRINLSNQDFVWKNIKINKSETYENVCKKGKRPRINFDKLIQQIPKKYYEVLFNDHLDLLY